MKKYIFFEILKQLQSRPALMKKVKIFAVVGVVGILIVGSLTVWLGFKAAQHVIGTAQNVLEAPTTQKQIEAAQANLQKIEFQPIQCWEKSISLLDMQPWLVRSISENLLSLKNECFATKTINENTY